MQSMSVLNEQICQKQTVIIFKLTKYDGYQYEASLERAKIDFMSD